MSDAVKRSGAIDFEKILMLRNDEGAPALLRGGAAQLQPQLHRTSCHLRGGLRGFFED